MRAKAAQDPEQSAHRSIADPTVRARLLADPEAGPLFFENTSSIFDRMAERIDGTRADIENSAQTEFALEEIEAPTLVIHGTVDKLVSYEEHAQRLAARIPSVRLLTIENGEHVAIFTHRDVVRAEVAQFLREHAPAAGKTRGRPATARATVSEAVPLTSE
jgi:pimeloyl-ACP methyl ester carboxylesterase